MKRVGLQTGLANKTFIVQVKICFSLFFILFVIVVERNKILVKVK